MNDDDLKKHLNYLKLPYMRDNYETVGKLAARKQ
jgi:hypothetical protein